VFRIKAAMSQRFNVHKDFAEEARKNLASLSNLRWQYFGSSSGDFVIFPGSCFDEDYDFRQR